MMHGHTYIKFVSFKFNLSTRWRWVINATIRSLPSQERDRVPTVQGAECKGFINKCLDHCNSDLL